ncbi:MAG TPA: RNA methyltransferase [Geobacterales bacterium]|nr:RNA methyltransferase [Geobacterales bacterium]
MSVLPEFPLLSVALIHYPVYDRNQQLVTTAVTNLDLHDIARAACTFSVAPYYVVTPVPAQQQLVSRIVGHWQEGWGADYNPHRRQALGAIRCCSTLDEALKDLRDEHGAEPLVIATGAQPRKGVIGFADLSRRLQHEQRPGLILLGTGWGLGDEVFDRADVTLAPISGAGTYNHLSVRSAASIIFDRLRNQH